MPFWWWVISPPNRQIRSDEDSHRQDERVRSDGAREALAGDREPGVASVRIKMLSVGLCLQRKPPLVQHERNDVLLCAFLDLGQLPRSGRSTV